MSGKAPTHHGRQRVEPWRPPALLRVALLSAGHVRFHDRQRLADRSPEIGSPRDFAGRVGTEGVDEQVTDARPTKLAVQVHSALSPVYLRVAGANNGMVQKQVTAQGWLMSTPEGDAPDPTLTPRGSLAVANWAPSHPALVTHEDPRVEPCLIPCGPSWSLSRLPAGPVLRSPLLVRLEMASICMHDIPRNATFSGFFENFGRSNSRRKSIFSNDLYPCFS